jgi:hypothetical protein
VDFDELRGLYERHADHPDEIVGSAGRLNWEYASSENLWPL